MGGAKVSDKIKVIENLITKCDKLLVGGAMAYTFLKAKGYNIGKSILDSDSITFCQNILTNYPDKLILPVDSKVASSMDTTDIKLRNIEEMKDEDIGLDIGPKTIELFQKNLKDAKRVIMNGQWAYLKILIILMVPKAYMIT